MMYAEYIHRGPGIPFTNQVIGELDYEEFSKTRLIPFLIAPVYVFALLFIFNLSSSTFLYLSNTQMKYLCQEGPVASVIIDPPHLPWSIYAYGPDGFAQERPVGCNTNVTGYPFPEGTRAMSSLSSLFLFLSILASKYLF